MTTADRQPAPDPRGPTPTSFLAAAAALDTIHEALHTARTPRDGEPGGEPSGKPPAPDAASSQQALAALLMLREARDQLAEWEAGLIEAAREAMANAAKHSGSTTITLYSEFVNGDAQIHVRDSGSGFVDDGRKSRVRERLARRVENAGGLVEIDTAPDSGTEITITVAT